MLRCCCRAGPSSPPVDSIVRHACVVHVRGRAVMCSVTEHSATLWLAHAGKGELRFWRAIASWRPLSLCEPVREGSARCACTNVF